MQRVKDVSSPLAIDPRFALPALVTLIHQLGTDAAAGRLADVISSLSAETRLLVAARLLSYADELLVKPVSPSLSRAVGDITCRLGGAALIQRIDAAND